MIRISGLRIHPLKSCRGIELDEAEVTDRGLRHDRRWLVVDPAGVFMTQRDHPRMATIGTAIDDRVLWLSAPGMPELALEISDVGTPRRVTVWRDRVEAVAVAGDSGEWLTEALGTPCELVRFPEAAVRRVDPGYARPDDRVGFADGFPFLLISDASLDELNRRLVAPLPMDRFRPNITVAGCAPHAEDGWRTMTVGPVTFHLVKPCARCVITTTDQLTGGRGNEPLRTLAQYRRRDREVHFGMNLVHDGRGTIRVGDPCTVD